MNGAVLVPRLSAGLFTTAVVTAIYNAPPGGTISVPSNGGYLLLRVSGVQHPAPPQNDLSYFQGVRSLSGEIAQDMTIGLAKASDQREGTTINQKLIDQTVVGSGSGS